jgi:RNA polymerase sigma-70 factor (ECF subfamily)
LTCHQPDILAFIISQMPGDPDACDVLQKCNMVLWKKREKFIEDSNFLAWAFRIARYEVLNHLKKQKNNKPMLLDAELMDKLAEDAPTTLHSDDLRIKALEICLNKLRVEDRELLEYRYQSDGGLSEFSKVTGRSVSALSVSLNRLRTLLRRCIVRQVALEGAGL